MILSCNNRLSQSYLIGWNSHVTTFYPNPSLLYDSILSQFSILILLQSDDLPISNPSISIFLISMIRFYHDCSSKYYMARWSTHITTVHSSPSWQTKHHIHPHKSAIHFHPIQSTFHLVISRFKHLYTQCFSYWIHFIYVEINHE